LLLDVAALLSASATGTFVAEAFVVPAAPAVAIVAPATPSSERTLWDHGAAEGAVTLALVPQSLDASPNPGGVGPDSVTQLRGTALLGQLGGLTRAELRAVLAEHPELVADILARPPAASEVADWWTGSPASAQLRLLSTAPELLGNLEGVPYEVRDTANRRFLDQARADIRDRLASGVGRAVEDELEVRLHMLEQVAQALEPGASGAPRSLVALDATGEGRAVIAVGDLATADYVSFLIPGMFYGVDARIVAWTETADALVVEQRAWLERLGRAGETVAAVSWIGYQTPTLVNVASMELARQGRDALTASLQGFAAARGDNAPYVSVLAHSYGSSAALLALQENDVTVDALAMVGSPGSPARSVEELRVRGGNVWVGLAEWDPIPHSGVFGSQPASPEYGARLFGVGGGADPATGAVLDGALSHNDYFAPGGESFRNLALIGIDADPLVLDPQGRSEAAIKAVGRAGVRGPVL